MTHTIIPPGMSTEEHFHTEEPLIQIGWQGHSGRIYRLDESVNEPGGFTPIYRHWGEKCGHQIQSEDMTTAIAEILGRSTS